MSPPTPQQQHPQQQNKEAPPPKKTTSLVGNESFTTEALYGLLSGFAFGLTSPLIGHPFDCVKTKMQADPNYATLNLMQSSKLFYHDGGFRGFYRGLLGPLVGSSLFRSIQFSGYSGAYALANDNAFFSSPIPFTGGLKGSVLVGGFVAAIARSAIESPIDFIKVRKIGNVPWTYNGLPPTLKTIVSVRQVKYMYIGYTATFLRTWGLLGSFFIMADYFQYIPEVVNAPILGPFFKGGICATAAWTVAFPFETVKSVIQSDTKGVFKGVGTMEVLGRIYKERGVRALYRGFSAGAARSFIANGVSMIVFAFTQDQLRS